MFLKVPVLPVLVWTRKRIRQKDMNVRGAEGEKLLGEPKFEIEQHLVLEVVGCLM